MVFYPPSWVPALPAVPDSITIEQFMNDETYNRKPLRESRNPYTCGITGKTYTAQETKERTNFLSRAIGKRLEFAPNDDATPWEKVVAVFSVNAIDYVPLSHAVHRLSGIVTPASAAYSAQELEHQLKSSGSVALFTCMPLLETALKAADGAGIPRNRIFLLEVPGAKAAGFVTVDELVREGQKLPEIEPLKWTKGQGARQPAYLCYSSGTSGLPKAVMIAHANVIANILQVTTYESVPRKQNGVGTQVSLGLLPFSHIYALVVICHVGTYRGDEIIVLPKFDLKTLLAAVQNFKIRQMCIVPPIIIALLRNQKLASQYDLSSLRILYSGAAPLGSETIDEVLRIFPDLRLCQGYGMTETATVVCTTSEEDRHPGTSGSLVPGAKAKIIDFEGNEVTTPETPGELLVQSPSVVLGYLNNEKANAETFVHHDDGRWIKTGDEVVIRISPLGNEHLVIVDRIKELIKVKGHQVAPAELEAHLLTHEFVSDCAVIQVPDDRAGEVPKAYVVRGTHAAAHPEDHVAKAIAKYVEDHKARHKWLKGGIEFIDVIPKSPSGKILRRMLRDKEKEARRAKGAKL
ncbi:hypothetical protein SAPIO_CDS7464 [Scedosporium apiospermum]|uniref:Uncharacterized protein n=1 Tax=Pseudallescheria apiosperma TaxID=563466 RepID=A0A084G1Y9_PSEDA|nr:uncharacterized protein SAPIO_CDS7464 [Scedosporium apiospermum]KEZ41351.1 hypothetical protein SAPIO_CDS7464 [Scedosporium apiospermum]